MASDLPHRPSSPRACHGGAGPSSPCLARPRGIARQCCRAYRPSWRPMFLRHANARGCLLGSRDPPSSLCLLFRRMRWHARSCAFRDKTLRGQASPEYQILPPLFGAMEPTACVCSDAKPSQSVVAPRARRKCPFVTGAKRCSTGDTSPQSSAGFPPAAEEAQPDRRSQIARRAGPTGHCSAPPRGADLSAGPAFLRGTKASGALPRSEPLRGSLLRARQPPSQENMLGPSLQWMESDSLQGHPLALSTIH